METDGVCWAPVAGWPVWELQWMCSAADPAGKLCQATLQDWLELAGLWGPREGMLHQGPLDGPAGVKGDAGMGHMKTLGQAKQSRLGRPAGSWSWSGHRLLPGVSCAPAA